MANHYFLINYELKTPSVEMACLLGIQNYILQAVCGPYIKKKIEVVLKLQYHSNATKNFVE
jgi:hypothetical protein